MPTNKSKPSLKKKAFRYADEQSDKSILYITKDASFFGSGAAGLSDINGDTRTNASSECGNSYDETMAMLSNIVSSSEDSEDSLLGTEEEDFESSVLYPHSKSKESFNKQCVQRRINRSNALKLLMLLGFVGALSGVRAVMTNYVKQMTHISPFQVIMFKGIVIMVAGFSRVGYDSLNCLRHMSGKLLTKTALLIVSMALALIFEINSLYHAPVSLGQIFIAATPIAGMGLTTVMTKISKVSLADILACKFCSICLYFLMYPQLSLFQPLTQAAGMEVNHHSVQTSLGIQLAVFASIFYAISFAILQNIGTRCLASTITAMAGLAITIFSICFMNTTVDSSVDSQTMKLFINFENAPLNGDDLFVLSMFGLFSWAFLELQTLLHQVDVGKYAFFFQGVVQLFTVIGFDHFYINSQWSTPEYLTCTAVLSILVIGSTGVFLDSECGQELEEEEESDEESTQKIQYQTHKQKMAKRRQRKQYTIPVTTKDKMRYIRDQEKKQLKNPAARYLIKDYKECV